MERTIIPCRAELASMRTDWEVTWRRARLPGLGSQLTSFLWRLLHCLLPTRERLHHHTATTSSLCQHCVVRREGEEGSLGTLQHELIDYSSNDNTGNILMTFLRLQVPDITAAQALRLEFGEVGEGVEAALTFLTTATLYKIWMTRQKKETRVRSTLIRAQLEACVAILRHTRHQNLYTGLQLLTYTPR